MKLYRFYLSNLFFFCFSILVLPQNFGLRKPLSDDLLPVSRSREISALKIPYHDHCRTLPKQDSDFHYRELNQGWTLASARTVEAAIFHTLFDQAPKQEWYEAVVPGTVLTSLVENQVFPDPLWGINNLQIPDSLCRTAWWYKTEFDIRDKNEYDFVSLLFEGINYKADVWVNGVFVGDIKGAFARGDFDITNCVNKQTKNTLAVKIYPPANPGFPHEESSRSGMGDNGGQLCMDGPTFFASEGWDWIPGIRDRNIGIWQPVKLHFTKGISIGDYQVITDLPLPDTTRADIKCVASLKNQAATSKKTDLVFEFNGTEICKTIEIEPLETVTVELTRDEFEKLTVNKPRLWWPVGYGSPALYDASLTVYADGQASDKKMFRFGIREFDYEFTVMDRNSELKDIRFNPIAGYAGKEPVFDVNERVLIDSAQQIYVPSLIPDLPVAGVDLIENSFSPFMALRVNGKRVFIRGGNWGMDDALKRVSKERMEPFIRFHREQNMNMIRNWTGQNTAEVLFDLCDEYGILVFNDFSMSTENYNLRPNDEKLLLDNVAETICRFRNHPSIAFWCARNEGFAPREVEQEFTRLTTSLDGTRYYSGNSIRLNLTGSGPWGIRNPDDNFSPAIARGFDTEIGTVSVPTAETMRKMMAEEDLWPIGDAWSYHDWHVGGWLAFDKLIPFMDERYGESTGIDDFCRKSQLLNYDAYRSIYEAFNSRMWNNTTGVLLWMSHPAWPSLTWQTYTFDYETPAAYFAVKQACRPLHIQKRPDNQLVQIVNTLDKEFTGVASLKLYDEHGKELFEQKQNISVPAAEVGTCFVFDAANLILPDVYLCRLAVADPKKKDRIINDYWHQTKEGGFKRLTARFSPDLEVGRVKKRNAGSYSFTIKNNSDRIVPGVKFSLRNKITREPFLPVYFSDGYFNLLPGEVRVISFEPGLPVHDAALYAESYVGDLVELAVM